MPASNPKSNATLTHTDNVDDFPGSSANPATVALPTGAATSAKQDTQIAAEQAIQVSVASIDTKASARDVILAALQVLLTAIDADTSRIPSLGNANMAASAPTTIASDDTLITAIKTAVEKLDNIVDANDHAVGVRPDPDAAETITAVDGSNPTEGQMVTIDVNTQDVVVKGKLTAADGNTAIDATVFVRERDTNEITSYAAFEDMEVAGNGSFTCSIKPTPAGAAIDRCGIRTDSVGAGTPTFTFALRQCK